MVLFKQTEQTLHSSYIVDLYLGSQQVKQATVQYLNVWKVQKNMAFQSGALLAILQEIFFTNYKLYLANLWINLIIKMHLLIKVYLPFELVEDKSPNCN